MKEYFTRPMTLAMADQAPGCFDEKYYIQRNKVNTCLCGLLHTQMRLLPAFAQELP